ncbi:YdcF family protein [Sediminibacillus dalangtanensis]|uniref:YdcF family protein n=1 Tax=Sediminibacillus dalangtanensis TaxID=2729421 RepID=A0ABX7VPB8_9BACI|nr:YdcF family protein [Sediminibacillus dalangtanensis]QTM98303.1 YdcF family protein [Sediminibacillus dalangtanensis]
MYISELNENKLTDAQLETLLFSGVEDDNQNGDCIVVAGSSMAVRYRLPKAIELYKQGRAGKILFSGGVKWGEKTVPEAIELKNEAVTLGIPEENILTEDLSRHTLENVLASLLVLDRAFHLYNIERLLIVTASYHMKRLYLTMKTYMPDWIAFSLCPADDLLTGKNNWFQTEHGRKRAFAEAAKIIRYVKQGALVDERIGE